MAEDVGILLGVIKAQKVMEQVGISDTPAVDTVPSGEIVITSTEIEIRQSGEGWAKIPGPANKLRPLLTIARQSLVGRRFR